MKILITGAWDCTESQLSEIEKMGHQAIFLPMETDAIPAEYCEIDAVICNGLFQHHNISLFINLKYIQLTSAGYDRVPLEYIKENNITIHNAKGVYDVPMAEFALSGVLSLYKQSKYFCENQINKVWKKNRDLRELFGSHVCIIGCGSVGCECAKKFKALGCNITGVDLLHIDNYLFDTVYNIESLNIALRNADVVIITLPLNESTYRLFDRSKFENMKNGAIIVNIARGGIVDTNEMITALETKLGGAVLDVFEQEPLETDSPLWSMENVILTPHNSFVGNGNAQRLWSTIKKNLTEYLSSK
ncbi:MAG: hydroxyacid dehydrogenase [Clostridia bacterium]|nr:hydroxyacid dehydrogenase [Clostridia bacterium]